MLENTAGYIAWSPSSWPNGAPYQARGSLPSHASVFPVALFAFPALKVGQKTKSRSRKLTHGFSGKWSNEKCFQFCRRFRVFRKHVHKFGANSSHGKKYGTMNRWLNFWFCIPQWRSICRMQMRSPFFFKEPIHNPVTWMSARQPPQM